MARFTSLSAAFGGSDQRICFTVTLPAPVVSPEPETPRLEIGSTWMAAAQQGTGVNAAAKLLLLERAFDALGCVAVELRTHAHNHQSRAAIARLGAHQDGILRSHLHHRGLLRDTVVFSILASEWPMVRRGLEARLAARAAK